MNETEVKNEQMIEYPNQTFFSDKSGIPKKEENQQKDSYESRSMEFTGKSSNRKMDSSVKYDIHFTLGGGTFNNIISFLSEVEYTIALCFRKKEVCMISIEGGNSHGAFAKFQNIEFSYYSIDSLKDEKDEKWILIDTSVITDELSINEEKPVDMYIDTIEKNRFYIINGKEKVEKQLNTMSTSDGEDALVKKHKGFESMLTRLTGDEKYQKTVINYAPLTGLMKSLLKKTDKSKDVTTLCSLYITKYELDWRVGDEVKQSSIMLSGEDIVVYPLKDDVFKFSLKFFNKFGKLKLNNSVEMYICGQMPIVLLSKLGGGGVRIWFLLAPRTDND
ncbi:MAG: hypothetical protein PHP08_00690 [Candidatus Dojkabacteria bacterium]|nr:hypothetical protein [Candidatus Dojkabacteria bacterium]